MMADGSNVRNPPESGLTSNMDACAIGLRKPGFATDPSSVRPHDRTRRSAAVRSPGLAEPVATVEHGIPRKMGCGDFGRTCRATVKLSLVLPHLKLLPKRFVVAS